MTPRRRAHADRESWPALAAFLRGYLHEDYEAEYGSIEGAVAAFVADASADERRALAAEAARLGALADRAPLAALQDLITRALGGRWLPRSRADLDALLSAIAQDRD